MDDSKINVSGLLAILHSALDGTDLTCKIIDLSCRDVHRLLNKWELPDEACTEDEKLIECSCNDQQHDEPLELARDIEHLLEKAKATREKVSEKKQQNKSYKFAPSNGMKSKTPLNPQTKKGTSIFQSRQISSASTSTKYPLPMIRCIENRERPKSAPSTVTSKLSTSLKDKNLKIKKSLIPFQTTYQRDFTELKTRKLTRQSYPLPNLQKKSSNNCESKRVGSISSLGGNCFKKPAIADIVGPLKRTTISNKGNHTSTANVRPTKVCPVHNAVVLKRSLKKNVSLQEAVDVLGVPPEVLKPLKTYYQYLSQNDDQLCLVHNKSLMARNKFVGKLNNVNVSSWNEVADEPVLDLWKEYSSVLQDTYSVMNPDGSGDQSTLRDLINKLDLLECAFQRTAEFDISPHNGQLSSDKQDDAFSDSADDDSKEWALAGIWNKKCQIMFSGMKQIMNMRYQDEKHCQLFQENLQKLQTIQLQLNILEVMKDEILQQMKQLDCDSPEFIKFYKMCCALCDISHLTIPILLRT